MILVLAVTLLATACGEAAPDLALREPPAAIAVDTLPEGIVEAVELVPGVGVSAEIREVLSANNRMNSELADEYYHVASIDSEVVVRWQESSGTWPFPSVHDCIGVFSDETSGSACWLVGEPQNFTFSGTAGNNNPIIVTNTPTGTAVVVVDNAHGESFASTVVDSIGIVRWEADANIASIAAYDANGVLLERS